MNEISSNFRFPTDIQLESNPLLEAWLEIHWQLEPSGPNESEFKRDPGFPFALGAFYKSVKSKFGHREGLDTSRAPEDVLPHIVRYRFRPEKDTWPLIQLGPGVATVNYTHPYTWDDFKDNALYLRRELLEAYGETELKTQMIALRYRNGELFEYRSSNLLDFFRRSLNTSIALPDHIPGSVSATTWPTSADIALSFDLLEPQGVGTLRLGTGIGRRIDPETNQEVRDKILIWQLEVASRGDNAPELNEEDEFSHWLTSAHAVIHEWFFSLIDGVLFEKYKGEVDSDAFNSTNS